MPDQLQLRGGTTAEHSTFTGASKEVTVDTSKKTVVVHDGTTAGGVPVMREDASNSALALGSQGAPSLKFTGDTNTGIYSPGADQLAISTGGSEKLIVKSDGKVGIGTSSPSTYGAQLAVIGGSVHADRNIGGAAAQVQFSMGASSGANFGQIGNTGTRWSLGYGTTANTIGTEVLVWSSSGNVGIGTTSPGAPLSVNGNAIIGPETGTRLAVNLTENDKVELQVIDSTSTARALALTVETTEAARIDSSGRLLVGTSSARSNFAGNTSTPLVQIEGVTAATASSSVVRGAADATGPTFNLGKTRGASVGQHTVVASDDQCGVITFQGADGTNLIRAAQISADVDGTPGSNDMPGRLVFSTTANGASSPTEALRITNDRVIGYNQAAPVAVDATATLTVANLKNGIITSTTAAAVTGTLPTGTDTEGGFSDLYNNFAFEWTVINTGATNNFTVAAGTAHTVVGNMVVAAGNSGRFATRRTAANTFVTYRLSS